MTFKYLLNLPQGSTKQIIGLDAWYDRFVGWCKRHPNFEAYHPGLWDAIHSTPEGKMARMRWICRKGMFQSRNQHPRP